MNFSLGSPGQGRPNCDLLRRCGSRNRRHSRRRLLLCRRRRHIGYIEIPLIITPFIQFRGPDNRPEQKTAHEAQCQNFHIVRCPQYPNDVVVAKSIAGSPIYAWAYPGTRAWPALGRKQKRSPGLEWELDRTLGGRSTHLTEDDQVRRRSWEDFRLPSTSWACTPSSRSIP